MNKHAIRRKSAKVVGAVVAVAVAATMSVSGIAFANTGNKYESQYDSFEEVLQAGSELNLEIASEGFVLMKNQNNALPLSKTERKVTVLGTAANALVYGGSGSGSQSSPGNGEYGRASTLYESLEAAGIQANPRVRDKYKSVPSLEAYAKLPREGGTYMTKVDSNGEVEFAGNKYVSKSNSSLAGADTNYNVYDGAAIVVISRGGREGDDNMASGIGGHSDATEHYLELDDAEKELMAYAKANFDKVVVLINSPSAMELGCLEHDDGISAVLWIGLPGWNGVMAVGEILTGKINPSGHLVDIYADDFTKDPTWYNNGTRTQAKLNVTAGSEYTGTALDGKIGFVDYAEGIYYGYRYYETVATDLGADGEEWYNEAVVYPFGHGLSYTNFTQKITDISGDLTKANGKVTVSVKVTNTGSVAGKDVVQLYNTPTYTAGGIEKASVNLVGFTKTGTINPGSSQTVSVTIDVKDLASFDYNDANNNSFCGYELEAGEYVLSIRSDSHNVLDSRTLNCGAALNWDEDGDANTPNNIYSQPIDSEWGAYNTLSNAWTESGDDHYLTRDQLIKDGKPADLEHLTWMLADDGEENAFTDEAFDVLKKVQETSVTDSEDDLWYIESVPEGWTQGDHEIDEDTGRYSIELNDMAGVPYNDAKWTTFMNQLTYDELLGIAATGGYYLYAGAEDTIGYPGLENADSSVQLSNGWAWACASVIASSWNVELAYEQGNIVGNESIMNGNYGWFGPGMDIRRNPLAGRNFEYYSQDGVQGGLIAASVVKGATDMGCRVFIKHSFLNDQETDRTGGVHFATEQAIREIYAKTFELAVKKGNANGIMTAFNLIGLSTSANYAACVQMYRNEWGFDGMLITDRWETGKMTQVGWNGDTMVRATVSALNADTKNNYALTTANYSGVWDADEETVLIDGEESATQWYWTRETAQRALYTVVNSNGMRNGYASYLFPDQTLELTAGVNANTSIVKDGIDDVFGSTGFTLSANNLPEGLSFNGGNITGAPSASLIGTTTQVNVSLRGNYGMSAISDTATITIKIVAPDESKADVYISGDKSDLTINTAVSGLTVKQRKVELTADNQFKGDIKTLNSAELINPHIGKYTSVSYSASGLPAGLTIDSSTGEISGTPTVSGTYYVEVKATLVQITGVDSKPMGISAKTSNVVYSAYASIVINGGYNVVFDANYVGGGQQVIGVANGNTLNGADITITTPVHPEGYSFLGWATTPNATVSDVTLNGDLDISEGVTYYAVWQMPSITIVNGNWWINGVDTGLSVAGQPGADGQNGQDGNDGLNGVGIVSIDKVSTEGVVDTYRITLSNGDSFDFEITNGVDGQDGEAGADGKDGTNGVNGTNGADGKDGSGCGSTIGIGSAAVAFAVVLAGLGVAVAVRKSKKEND